MSCFLEILRCILCCEEENHGGYRDYEALNTTRQYPSHIRRDFIEDSKIKEVVYLRNSIHPGTSKLIEHTQNQNQSPTTPFPKNPASLSYKPPLPSSSSGPPLFFPKPSPPPYSSGQKPSSPKPLPPPASSGPPYSSEQKPSAPKPLPPPASSGPPYSSGQKPSAPKPLPPPASSGPPPSTSKPSGLPPFSSKPPTSPSPSRFPLDPPIPPKKTKNIVVQKGTSPIYEIPEDIKDLLKKDKLPKVLKKPLSSSTYTNYFAALLYAEDFYFEKWSNFCLSNISLEDGEKFFKKSRKNKALIESDKGDEKIFIAFEIDSIPERRPFLLSRDFVLARPSGKKVEPFQGILNRVVKSTHVLAEFGDDFHSQHYPHRKYDVSFNFNRVCLKRSHQAVAAAMDPLFWSFLFPNQTSRISFHPSSRIPSYPNLDKEQASAVYYISRLSGPPPYLIEGPLSVTSVKELSRTGLVVQKAVLQICRTTPGCRILISAPTNSTCDVLMRGLKEEIPESDLFRANAAFRELDGVPYDILPSCLYKGECFTCPSLQELRNFKVILSTFVSSFRLHSEGISAGHFSHIFLVDASSATEPETMVVLSNLANENTVVVVTGASGNSSRWVRSDIARRNGLMISYFQRLFESKPYCSLNPMLVSCIGSNGPESYNTNRF